LSAAVLPAGTNVAVHGRDTGQNNELNLKSAKLSSVQKGVCCSSIRLFDKLPPHIVKLLENTMTFKDTPNKFS
jgi:hypothetical protein